MSTATIIWEGGGYTDILNVKLFSSDNGWDAKPMVGTGNGFSTTINIPEGGVYFKIQVVRQGSINWVLLPKYHKRFDSSGNENNYIALPPLKSVSARSRFWMAGIRKSLATCCLLLAIFCFLFICSFTIVLPQPLNKRPPHPASRIIDTRAFRASLPNTLQSLDVGRGRPTGVDQFYHGIVIYLGTVSGLPADCPESKISSSITQGRSIQENHSLAETISYSQGLTLEEREYRFELYKNLYDMLSNIQASLQSLLPTQEVPTGDANIWSLLDRLLQSPRHDTGTSRF